MSQLLNERMIKKSIVSSSHHLCFTSSDNSHGHVGNIIYLKQTVSRQASDFLNA